MKKSSKNTIKNLILLFLLIFGIKTLISFFFSGTYFYSDEACVIAKAKHLAEYFRLIECSQAAEAPAGDPHPFYSIILAPIYLFTKGNLAYHLVLVLNSLLISSLVFPLYGIIKKFIKKDHIIFFITFIILFLPQITTFEKMVLTELPFIFINIWFLHFYMNYHDQKKGKKKNLILSILFAIFAGFARPFGFIVPLAMAVNEIIVAKNKKLALFVFAPIAILLFIFALGLLVGLGEQLMNKIINISDPVYFINGLKALKDQYNSVLIASYFVPVIIFATYFNEKTPIIFKKIRFFLIFLFFFNFIISANHMHTYLIQGLTLDVLTRYINISLIFIYLFAFIFLFKYKKFTLKLGNTIIIAISLLTFALIKYQEVKHSLNVDLSLFYNTGYFKSGNLIGDNVFIAYYFIPLCFSLFVLLFLNKQRILIIVLSTIILVQSAALYGWNIKFAKASVEGDVVLQEFKDTEHNLLFIQTFESKVVSFSYWNTKTLSSNDTKVMYLAKGKKLLPEPNFYSESTKKEFEGFDYIITRIVITVPIYKKLNDELAAYHIPKGGSYEEHIKLLEEEGINYLPAKTIK